MTSSRLPRARRRALVASLALVLVAGVGCMQSDTKTTILADGSGTCTDTMVFDIAKSKDLMEAVKMLGAMQGGGGGGGGGMGGLGALPPDFDVEKVLEAQYGEAAMKAQLLAVPGVAVKSVSSEVKDGKRTSRREFAFADFSALGKVVFQVGTAELKKNEDGSYTLEMDAIGLVRGALADAAAQAGGAGGAPGGMSGMDMLGFFGQMVPDLKMKRDFTVPGEVIETNGKKSEDGKTVSWSFAATDLSSAGTDPAKVPGKMSVRFKGEGLTLKPFKYAPDMKELRKAMQLPKAATPAEPTKPGEPAKPADGVKPPEPK